MSSAIPNWLVLSLAGLYYGCAVAFGVAPNIVIEHTVIGFVAVFGAMWAAASGVPGGAAKLFAVGFLWFGISGGAHFVMYSYMPPVMLAWGLRAIGRPIDAGIPVLPFAILAAIIVTPHHAAWITS